MEGGYYHDEREGLVDAASDAKALSLSVTDMLPLEDDILLDVLQRKRQGRNIEALYQLGWSQILLYDEPTILRCALEVAAQVLDFDFASFSLVDTDASALRVHYFLERGVLKTVERFIALDSPRSISAAVAREGIALNVPDVRRDPRYLPYDEAAPPTCSELCVPMKLHGAVIGVLNVESGERNHFTATDQFLLQILANQTAVAVQNARLYAQTQRNAREFSALISATHALSANLDLNTVLQQTLVQINTLLEAEDASVLLYDNASEDLVFAAVASSNTSAILFGQHVSLDAGVAGWVMRNKTSAIVENAQEDPRFFREIDALTAVTTRSLLAVPLITKDRVIGVLEVINKVDGAFNTHDRELLEALASSAAIAIDNARLYQELIDQIQLLQATQVKLIQSEKMGALGRLIASISHEINNPLQSIQGCLTLAKEELESPARPDKIVRYLDIAEGEIERIATIVRRVREFYRPSGRERAPTDIHQTLESVLALSGKELQHSFVEVERIWDPAIPLIVVNQDHLRQVFLNLVINAIDAMPKGGTLTIRTILDHKNVIIEFADTGIGMSPEVQARLFEPFFTTKAHGSGLGLSISYGIIQEHNGQILVQSEVGKGTTFTIVLPVA
ncbi:MAG: GAF domain-containing protein [Anaerolineae bacterium]